MTNMKGNRDWILTRSQTFQPGKTLRLGQLLVHPRQPAGALLTRTGTFVDIPGDYTRDKGRLKNVMIAMESKLRISLDAWVKANGAPMAAKGESSAERESQRTWNLDAIEYDSFLPDLWYVGEVLKAGDVPKATAWYKLRQRLFLVTGVRIARGASVSAVDARKSEVSGELSGGPPGETAPVEGGLKAAKDKSSRYAETAERCDDFVFAYRLHEIRWFPVLSKTVHKGGDTESAREEEGDAAGTAKQSEEDEITGYDLADVAAFNAEHIFDYDDDEDTEMVA